MGAEHSTPAPVLFNKTQTRFDSSATLTEEPGSFEAPPKAQPIPIPQSSAHAQPKHNEQRRHTLPALDVYQTQTSGPVPLRRFSLASTTSNAPSLATSGAASPTDYIPFASYRGQSLRKLSLPLPTATVPQQQQPLPLQDQQQQLLQPQPLKQQQQLPVDFVAWASFD
ncbi:UNVERIFIED_CONTAM: hypothetical protein HDU68_000480 [Siphonaria sp. JEL0065]|nr:hypothetical protein HDU68_000480 [Siphonaria sp. JEL0065]